jgi:hypothetical protein
LEKKPDLAAWIALLLLFMIVYNASLPAGELDESVPGGSDWMGMGGSGPVRLPWERGIEGWRRSASTVAGGLEGTGSEWGRTDWKGLTASRVREQESGTT